MSLAAPRRVTLEEALNRARCFHDNWKKEADWLSDAERQIYADWSPHALPQTCDTDLEQHKVPYCTSRVGNSIYSSNLSEHSIFTIKVIKKFTRPARFTGTRSKTTGLERPTTKRPVPFCTAAFKGQF